MKEAAEPRAAGGINAEGNPNSNWCTQTSSAAIIAALRDMGYAPKFKLKRISVSASAAAPAGDSAPA